MNKDLLDNLAKASQMTFDNLKKIAKTNQDVAEKLLKEQNDLTKILIDTAEKSSGVLKTVKDPKDIQDASSKQADLAQETAENLMESARSCADVLSEAGKVYNKIFEASAETATKAASAKGTKAA